jgi:deoxyribose-phosphate aldolase
MVEINFVFYFLCFYFFSQQAAWLLKAVTFIDLTTLSGDDTSSNIQRLCYKAKYPIREDLLKALNVHDRGNV